MKRLAQFSIDYPITIAMMVLAVLLLGYISFQKLGIDLFPDVSNPRIFVELKAGELPPEEVEQKFVKNIEAQAIRQKNVIRVSSVSRVGSARVTVEYSWQTSMDEAFLNLQKALSDFKQLSGIDEFLITQHDPNSAPVILLAFTHPDITDMDELRKVAESYLRNELIRLEGIADVRLLGQEEKEVIVQTNSYMLEAYNIDVNTLSQQIQAYNRNISGGSIEEMGRRYIIKGVGEISSLDEIKNIVVSYTSPEIPGGQTQNGSQSESFSGRVPVYLSEVADVYFRNKKPENIVRMDGKRCMGLAVYKEMKYNTVEAVNEFMNALERVTKALPGYELIIIQNQGEFITTAIDEVKKTALIGIILAVIILYVFLRRIGTTAVISTAIPISIVATFNLMYFNGLTLNIMTLGGLALGAGMLVDNAIVVMENIYRNIEEGIPLKEAAVTGTAQVSGAITASTLTTIFVFLPIVYLHGTAGELFKEQAWTVGFSLLSSLFVAILVIPMLSARMIKTKAPLPDSGKTTHFKWYGAFLARVLRLRWTVIILAILLVFGSLQLIPLIGSEFIPKTDMNEISIELRLPEGTELNRTYATVENIEQSILNLFGDEIQSVFSVSGPSGDVIGSSESLFEDENTATIKIGLKENHRVTSDAFIAGVSSILTEIPDIETRFIQEQTVLELTLGSEQSPIVIEIQGEDIDTLQKLTDQARVKALSIDELYNVETSFEEGRPEIDVVLDRIRAGMYNIGIESISNQLRNKLMGTEAGQMENEGELKDITIELPPFGVNQIDDIVIGSGSNEVRLHEIADISMSTAPKEIYRNNQARIGKVTADLKAGIPLDRVVARISKAMSDITFPPNYRYEITGEEQKRREAFQNLKFALLLSFILVYMVLASQFESLIHPFTIILSIPLAVVGAILLFFILGKSLNIMAYIGIIMLVGIAVNDSIILVDMINQLKKEGLSRTSAIIEAGQRRIRPIIMTSLTTITALLPLTLGFGEGAALRSPMALAVIGGLITSTLLTLVVIPCVYSVMDSIRN